MLDVVIESNRIRIGPRFAVTFHRTLRIPDDGRVYPLPPGLGALPVRSVADYRDRVPEEWRRSPGAFIALYRREAMWIGLHGATWKPNAVKIAVGGVNVLTGEPDSPVLTGDPQNYVVAPFQPWVDGIRTRRGVVRQFVAMPLGEGYTVEAAITGDERRGGLQLTVFEPRPGRFPDAPPEPSMPAAPVRNASPSMGFGAGGAVRQKLYPDPYGIDTWDPEARASVEVHILDSRSYRAITGEAPPPTPIDAATYTAHGLPWFELYDEERGDIGPSERLTGATPIAELDAERGGEGAGRRSVDVPATQVTRISPGPAPGESGTGPGKKGDRQ